VNPDNSPAIVSNETEASLDYARQLHETMLDGVASWGDPSNNQAFLAGQLALSSSKNGQVGNRVSPFRLLGRATSGKLRPTRAAAAPWAVR
jgi:hypothetical protein